MNYEELNETNRWPKETDDDETLDAKIQYYIDHHYCISDIRMLDRISKRYKDLERKYNESLRIINSQVFKNFETSCDKTYLSNVVNDIKAKVTNDLKNKVQSESLRKVFGKLNKMKPKVT